MKTLEVVQAATLFYVEEEFGPKIFFLQKEHADEYVRLRAEVALAYAGLCEVQLKFEQTATTCDEYRLTHQFVPRM